jgi:hypothetical protein
MSGTLTDKMFMAEVCAVMIVVVLLLVVIFVIYGVIDLFNWIKKRMKRRD